jgi:hypothetical protein
MSDEIKNLAFIDVYYEEWSDSDLECGDTDNKGEYDSHEYYLDEYDIDDCKTIVDLMIEAFDKWGSVEPSSSAWYDGVWYTTIDPEIDYRTGTHTFYSYHPKGLSSEESKELFNMMSKKR